MGGSFPTAEFVSAWHDPSVSFDTAAAGPITSFVVKVASRCNIDCDYCFMYHAADQSWRTRPKIIADNTVRAAARIINEHVQSHGVDRITIALHGGEPLLLGRARLARIADTFRSGINCNVDLGLQTNAILINDAWIEFFAKFEVKVGVSLDGDRASNDRHRLKFSKQSTFDQAVGGLRLLLASKTGRAAFSGLLCVIDPRNSPSDLLKFIDALGVDNVDLLLPHGNHTHPPAGLPDPRGNTLYADWMIEFFDEWFARFQHIKVRYFEEIIALMLGGASRLEAIGATSVNLLVIETDGNIEALDSLKVSERQFTNLGLNVFRDALDDAIRHPAIYSRMMGYRALSQECQACHFVEICAGGYLPHRYRSENGFRNPSVYCLGLKKLMKHIHKTLRGALIENAPVV
jgi:uncharacterized protein